MTKELKINPYLSIKFHTDLGLILVNNYNKLSYQLNKEMLRELSSSRPNNELIKSDIIYTEKRFKKESFLKPKILNFYKSYIDTLSYHIHCYRYPFLDYQDEKAYDVDWALMEKYYKKRKPVSQYKKYPEAKKIRLISSNPDSDFGIKNGDFDSFALLSFGKATNRIKSKYLYKTVPSGGAKHPTEIYLVFSDSTIYQAGIYHYNVDEHALELIKKGNFLNQLEVEDAKFAVVYTSMVERAMFRYRDLRSTRAILMDLGHILENTKLVAESFGYESKTSYSIDSDLLSNFLNLKKNEPVLAIQTFN